MPDPDRVAMVTLGCGRNDVDSEQVAGALQHAGLAVVDEPADADCVLVNTCTFVEAARVESIDAILQAADPDDRAGQPPAVIVMGCMAQRYRDTLSHELPEAAAVVGFGDYPRLPDIVAAAIAGSPDPVGDAAPQPSSTAPGAGGAFDRALPRISADGDADPPRGLPLAVAPAAPPTTAFPVRTEPRGGWAYVKIAGGCDRACTFCTIPSYRGTHRSRPVAEVLAEARWLVAHGVSELVCVSENTTSYGKDLPQGRQALLELLDGFEGIDGLKRVRLLYLQPDELEPELLAAMSASRVVAPYYDLSLQHASAPVLRRMARGGSREAFVDLVDDIRARDPAAVVRSSFILGFPGETDADVAELASFLDRAAIDWPGFFTFSREDGTPSADMEGQIPGDVAAARRDHVADIAELAAEERARGFVGVDLSVLIEHADGPDGAVGRSHREGPESDGEIRLPDVAPDAVAAGDVVAARAVAADGVDLIAETAPAVTRGGRPVTAGS
jgi:ribosomal protein S12 methylthiotransferase RimO